MQNQWIHKLDTVSTVREVTEGVRAAINARGEKLSDEEVLDLIEDFVLQDPRLALYSHKVKGNVIEGTFNATRKELDILQPYAYDEDVNEIMVNGTDGIFIERGGKIEKLDICFETKEEIEEIIRRLAGKVHREINELNPIVDARMDDGSRIHAVYKNVAINGPILTIRKFPKKRITMGELLEKGTLTEEAAVFLEKLVLSGHNIFISGGTSSGKTTVLNALSGFIPKDERVVVIEDSAELQISEIENIVRMETRNANVQGKGQVTMRQLIRASLRMRPDRIVVGEVRGEEVLDMLQAMNTGHDGSLSTGHGNSTTGMLRRLEAMFLTAANFPVDAIRNQIGEALDIMIHLGRMPDKSRKVLEITEVAGYQNGQFILNPLFRFSAGMLCPTGNKMIKTHKLERNGEAV